MEVVIEITVTLVVILGVLFFISFFMTKKQKRMLAKISSDDAVVQSICEICKDGLRAPGIAQIINGTLITCTILGTKTKCPIKEIKVTKETIGIGKFGWIGKHIFILKLPQGASLALGISSTEAPCWREAFNSE